MTLDGEDLSRIFTVSVGTGNRNNLTLTNGWTDDKKGGAVLVEAGALANIDASIVSNSAAFYGGSIVNAGTLRLLNSELYGKTATVSGGAISNYFTGSMELENVTLAYNTAQSYSGALDNLGDLSVQNSTMFGNVSNWYAGAIFSNSDFTM